VAKSATKNRRNIIFLGLVLGMLVAVTNQTLVSPAMPVIVADLGGIEHYSWIATSTLLAVAVSVPVVGKLSDIYGRRYAYPSPGWQEPNPTTEGVAKTTDEERPGLRYYW
jgi:MFS family permease